MEIKINLRELKKLLDKETCLEERHKDKETIKFDFEKDNLQITPCCEKFGDKLKGIVKKELDRELLGQVEIEKVIKDIFYYPHF